MTRIVKLNSLEELVEDHSFPMSREEARSTFDDVTLDLADGTVSISETLEESQVSTFETAEDFVSELYTHLPRRAVGEPFQSEGEG